jgi:hypothetical protein
VNFIATAPIYPWGRDRQGAESSPAPARSVDFVRISTGVGVGIGVRACQRGVQEAVPAKGVADGSIIVATARILHRPQELDTKGFSFEVYQRSRTFPEDSIIQEEQLDMSSRAKI